MRPMALLMMTAGMCSEMRVTDDDFDFVISHDWDQNKTQESFYQQYFLNNLIFANWWIHSNTSVLLSFMTFRFCLQGPYLGLVPTLKTTDLSLFVQE